MPLVLRALVTVVLLLAGGTTVTTAGAKDPCPDARTCPSFMRLGDDGTPTWPVDADGITRLRYVIREPMPPRVSLEDFRGAAAAAARAWNRVGAKVEILDAGVVPATYVPEAHIDGIVAWSAAAPHGLGSYSSVTHPTLHPDDPGNDPLRQPDRRLFYIELNPVYSPWSWHPCDGSTTSPCTSVAGVIGNEMQSVLTHEFGHLLGLLHVDGPRHVEMTLSAWMLCEGEGVCRQASTPALGDMLGVRAAFGVRAPLPRVARP